MRPERLPVFVAIPSAGYTLMAKSTPDNLMEVRKQGRSQTWGGTPTRAAPTHATNKAGDYRRGTRPRSRHWHDGGLRCECCPHNAHCGTFACVCVCVQRKLRPCVSKHPGLGAEQALRRKLTSPSKAEPWPNGRHNGRNAKGPMLSCCAKHTERRLPPRRSKRCRDSSMQVRRMLYYFAAMRWEGTKTQT